MPDKKFMWPHPLLQVGQIELHLYGLILIAVYLLAFGFTCWETRGHNGFFPKFLDISFWMIIGGIVGARLFYVVFNWSEFQHSPIEIFAFWKGGMVYYGSIIGGGLASFWAARKNNLSFLFYGDIIFPYIVLSSGLGRIACFLQGCCYGKPTNLPWGIKFEDPSSLAKPLGISLHPVQIYLLIAGILIFVMLRFAFQRKRFDGEIVFLSFILYSVSRFMIDFFRGDLGLYNFLGLQLSNSQIISLFVLTLGTVLFIMFDQKAVKQELIKEIQ